MDYFFNKMDIKEDNQVSKVADTDTFLEKFCC